MQMTHHTPSLHKTKHAVAVYTFTCHIKKQDIQIYSISFRMQRTQLVTVAFPLQKQFNVLGIIVVIMYTRSWLDSPYKKLFIKVIWLWR